MVACRSHFERVLQYSRLRGKMRILVVSFLLCLSATQVFGYTFVLKSGKRIKGVLLIEETSTVRIEDHTGVPMTLKKASVDWSATIQANPPEPQPADPIMEPEVPAPRARSATVFRNVPGVYSRNPTIPRTEKEWKERLRAAEKEYFRYKDACRNAGTGPDVKRRLESHVYHVNGKKVTVTGYWAHPESVRSANQICQRAIHAEMDLAEARQALDELKSAKASSTSGGAATGIPATNRR